MWTAVFLCMLQPLPAEPVRCGYIPTPFPTEQACRDGAQEVLAHGDLQLLPSRTTFACEWHADQ